MSVLFQPLTVGALELPNRLVMAPLTRSRAGESRIPNELMQEYYVQRASAGLIITEATAITPSAVGYANTPGIWSDEQVAGWKKITDAVRAAGGRMVMQLWHVGRISDPIFLNGELPVAPSAIQPAGHVSLVRPKKEYVTPRALTTAEVKQIVQDYRQAAINAKAAGFDGVELHAANGYLIDQFLQTKTNQRNDEYGGSLENRARLLLEVTDQLIDVWGADRVGVHLAPRRDAHDMGDDNPPQTFGYVAEQLGQRKIAFICAREYVADDSLAGLIKQKFGGVFIANEKLEREQAERLIELGEADAVAFGQLYIANPDLLERFKQQAELNTPNPATYYAEGATGYTDYPFLGESV
ncbi:alkene reductase [Alkanindiges hydrocarboniclasticus]|uniref:Alkene reductase n=1 Tax=Alkanindiges hydrocarboniclasticus TaxID=1907941 RepID=A0A1S8CU44_9GAMM|nr:alkene reductase [Alkanindiges hydrocarboniclasticus]ONG40051.1 alkene reductase [Alkanindiges hydrocarboniclasticus]